MRSLAFGSETKPSSSVLVCRLLAPVTVALTLVTFLVYYRLSPGSVRSSLAFFTKWSWASRFPRPAQIPVNGDVNSGNYFQVGGEIDSQLVTRPSSSTRVWRGLLWKAVSRFIHSKMLSQSKLKSELIIEDGETHRLTLREIMAMSLGISMDLFHVTPN
ncbi:hypothetical protein YC2023_083827 [Brassica napus]